MTVFMLRQGSMVRIYLSKLFKIAVLRVHLNILAYIAQSYNYQ